MDRLSEIITYTVRGFGIKSGSFDICYSQRWSTEQEPLLLALLHDTDPEGIAILQKMMTGIDVPITQVVFVAHLLDQINTSRTGQVIEVPELVHRALALTGHQFPDRRPNHTLLYLMVMMFPPVIGTIMATLITLVYLSLKK